MGKPIRLPIALQQAVMCSLRNHLQQANQQLATCYSEPRISYRQNGTIAGSAWLKQWEIRLNPILLLENGQIFIDQVIPHELAHLLVYKQFGPVAPHGKEWIWMMEQILQTPAERTHPFATDSVSSTTFPYRCACQLHQLTLRRHNRIQRNQGSYRCKQCHTLLLLCSADSTSIEK